MADDDDLDALLDDISATMGHNPQTPPKAKKTTSTAATNPPLHIGGAAMNNINTNNNNNNNSSKSHSLDDIDELLHSLNDSPLPKSKHQQQHQHDIAAKVNPIVTSSDMIASGSTGTTPISTPLLSGTPSATPTRKNRCFPPCLGGSDVPLGLSSMIEKSVWSPHCDYLFFRNNVPDRTKLAVNIEKKSGDCAYCCQCTWRSVPQGTIMPISTNEEGMRWVCAGH